MPSPGRPFVDRRLEYLGFSIILADSRAYSQPLTKLYDNVLHGRWEFIEPRKHLIIFGLTTHLFLLPFRAGWMLDAISAMP